MNQQEQIVFNFYTAFQNLDSEKMVSLYSHDIVFEDPAFGILKGQDANNMWRMLCENSVDLDLKFHITSSKNNKVYAFWEAHYTFSKTGRKVINKVNAELIIKDEKIIKHTDTFNLWDWSKQAMGLTGWFIGWSNFFKTKLHQTTGEMLHKYTVKRDSTE